VKICSSQLTAWRVPNDGSNVELGFLDASGAEVIVQLPIIQAEASTMTLPRLLTWAIRQSTGNQQSRYVFDLGEWALEGTKGEPRLIATLKTTDGFEVSFGIPFEACRLLAWYLRYGADLAPDDAGTTGDEKSALWNASSRLN
jgi:hypothetical protein